MAQDWAKAFYSSKKWLKSRAGYISQRRMIDGGMCEHCRNRTGYIVDHIEELTPENITDPEIALNYDNFQYLCTECHNRKTLGSGSVQSGLTFDESGELVRVKTLSCDEA